MLAGERETGRVGRARRSGVTHEEDGPVFPCAVKDEEPHRGAEELGTEAVAHSCVESKHDHRGGECGSVVGTGTESETPRGLTDLGGEGGIHLQGLRVLQPSSLDRSEELLEGERERQVEVDDENEVDSRPLTRSLCRSDDRPNRPETALMRSLELIAASFDSLAPTTAASSSSQTRPSTAPSSTLCATTVDPATETKYAVLVADPENEQSEEGAFANLQVYRLASRPGQLVRLASTTTLAMLPFEGMLN